MTAGAVTVDVALRMNATERVDVQAGLTGVSLQSRQNMATITLSGATWICCQTIRPAADASHARGHDRHAADQVASISTVHRSIGGCAQGHHPGDPHQCELVLGRICGAGASPYRHHHKPAEAMPRDDR